MSDVQTLVDPATVAVVVVDVQNDFVHPEGRGGRDGSDVAPLLKAVDAINRLIEEARSTPATIVYVRTEHGPNVDVAPYQARYERRGMSPSDTLCHGGSWGAELYTNLLPPRSGELEVVKHGYDAFQRTPLVELLRERGVTTVIVTGVVTNHCVRATAYSAFEQGFFVVVPRETTAAKNPEDASRALEDIAAWYGEIVSLDEVVAAWRGMPSVADHDASKLRQADRTR
jgi:nicotinamidase-related amidase